MSTLNKITPRLRKNPFPTDGVSIKLKTQILLIVSHDNIGTKHKGETQKSLLKKSSFV